MFYVVQVVKKVKGPVEISMWQLESCPDPGSALYAFPAGLVRDVHAHVMDERTVCPNPSEKGGPHYLCMLDVASFWSEQVTCWQVPLLRSWGHQEGHLPPAHYLRPQAAQAHPPNSLHHLLEHPLEEE